MKDDTDLFSKEDLFYSLEEHEKELIEESSEELDDLLVINESLSLIKEIIHGVKDFDINDLISD
ncbi:6329_t:CDS:2 [Cetraspora pellucida]|uniref:6329_t:CDS:1 n=1 Tax=Cetraspora pellucida TaxID=1433469 RepID=A0A9N9D6Y5_9GLOM|nr:6329_t:CDS:2 [Cetraspora pellucida]